MTARYKALFMLCFMLIGMPIMEAMAKDKQILMVYWRGRTETETAFLKRLDEKGIKYQLTEINGEQDRAKLGALIRPLESRIQAKEFDLAYTHGTTATTVALQVIGIQMPVVFNIVYDPVGVKFVESLEKPGANITGGTNGVPIEDQFEAFQKIRPIKTLIHLFNAREKNSNLLDARVTAWAAKAGVTVIAERVAPDDGDNSLRQVLERIKTGEVKGDVLYAGADSYLSTRSEMIDAAVGANLPLFGGTQTFILRGWLAAYAPTVEDLGSAVADQAIDILSGKSPGEIPVVLPKPRVIMSRTAAERLGIAIPADAVVEK